MTITFGFKSYGLASGFLLGLIFRCKNFGRCAFLIPLAPPAPPGIILLFWRGVGSSVWHSVLYGKEGLWVAKSWVKLCDIWKMGRKSWLIVGDQG